MEYYVGFAVYEAPQKPWQHGKYIGKTPILAQAVTACENAKASGKDYFIKGIRTDGTEVVLL